MGEYLLYCGSCREHYYKQLGSLAVCPRCAAMGREETVDVVKEIKTPEVEERKTKGTGASRHSRDKVG